MESTPLPDALLILLILMPVIMVLIEIFIFRPLRSQQKVVAKQFHVLDEEAIHYYRGAEESAGERAEWDRLMRRIRQRTGGVVRLGHVVWVGMVQNGRTPEEPIPTFEPPPDWPYDLETDPGFSALRAYWHAGLDTGIPVRHLQDLERAAQQGSLCAMTQFGVELVRGRVPGRGAEESKSEGREMLERACSVNRSPEAAASYASLLLEGRYLPTDSERGLALLHQAAQLGHDMSLELAGIYQVGKYGVPADPEAATAWALKGAPLWRRMLHRIGLKQHRWREQLVRRREAIARQSENMSIEDSRLALRARFRK